MKHLIRTVDLRFFQDDANGEYGLAHAETLAGPNGSDGFNAFWDGRGLQHDVFEHAHEFTSPYFRGDYAMNVGGEMAAMGALWYYFDTLGLHERQFPGQIHWMGDTMRRGTEDMVKETLNEGYCQFGYTLESNVPRQRPTDNSELEAQLDLYWDNVKGYKGRERPRGAVGRLFKEEIDREAEFISVYRKSLTKRKIQDLHRWGYRMAEKLVPNTYENRETLAGFIAFWDAFCKRNKAEELAALYRGLIVKLFRDGETVSWEAYLVTQDGGEVKVTEHFHVEDLYQLDLEEAMA